MADETQDFDTVSLDQLDPIALALDQIFAVANVNGKLFKSKLSDLIAFVAPLIPGVSSSNFAPVTGTVLPNNTSSPSQFTFVGSGTFTQTTGGSITTTSLLNLLGWNGTTWVLLKAIDTSAFLAKSDYNFGGKFATTTAANAAILNTVVNGVNQRDGKRVDIGSAGNYTPYWWSGGTTDANLVPFFVSLMSKAEYPNVSSLESKFIPGKNKFNGVVNEGGYLDSGGFLATNATSSYSDFQAVTPGTTETVSGLTYDTATGFVVVFYDANKVKLTSGAALTGNAARTHVIPTGAAFKRYNTRFVQTTPSYGTIQSEVGAVATAYEPYTTVLNVVINTPDKSIQGVKIADKAITPIKTSFFNNRTNIFNKDTMVKTGFLLNNSDGVEVASAGWAYATIPVVPANSNVFVTKGLSNVSASDDTLHFFNSSGVWISASQALTAPIPATAATLRFNITNTAANLLAAKNSIVVEYGTSAGSDIYVSFGAGNTIPLINIQKDNDARAGKIVTVVGDSIVKGTGGFTSWVDLLQAKLNITTINRGDNGATITNINPTISTVSGNLLTSGFNAASSIFVFAAGTNDYANNQPIGTLQDTTDTTVKGSLIKAINYVKTNAPNAKILLCTPIERSDRTNANTLGLKLIDYRNAIIDVANGTGVQYLDMYYNNLISIPTVYKYLQADMLHPNDGGYVAMIDVIAPVISRMLLQ